MIKFTLEEKCALFSHKKLWLMTHVRGRLHDFFPTMCDMWCLLWHMLHKNDDLTLCNGTCTALIHNEFNQIYAIKELDWTTEKHFNAHQKPPQLSWNQINIHVTCNVYKIEIKFTSTVSHGGYSLAPPMLRHPLLKWSKKMHSHFTICIFFNTPGKLVQLPMSEV
jgi:hypothetical protein